MLLLVLSYAWFTDIVNESTNLITYELDKFVEKLRKENDVK